MYYMDCDLYRYTIGRAGQSVQESVMCRRYAHQLKATELCFTAFHLDDIPERSKKVYLKHEMFMMLGIAVLYARMNGTTQAERDLEAMWENCRKYDEKWAKHFQRNLGLMLMSIPGKGGAGAVRGVYRAAHLVVRFN